MPTGFTASRKHRSLGKWRYGALAISGTDFARRKDATPSASDPMASKPCQVTLAHDSGGKKAQQSGRRKGRQRRQLRNAHRYPQ